MKIGILEIAPELAVEAFQVLRDSGALVLGSTESGPALRVVVSHELLPPECAPDPRKPTPIVMMSVRSSDEEGRHRLTGFSLNPWAAPAVKRRAR